VVCGLLGVESAEHLKAHSSRGAIFETFVLSEIKKHFNNNFSAQKLLYFWKDHRDLEVDIMIELGEDLLAIEVKSGTTLGKDFTKNLLHWQKSSKVKTDKLKLVYGGDSQKQLDGIDILPWNRINNLIQK
jgi:predicted AAA+ superfamily ATPase